MREQRDKTHYTVSIDHSLEKLYSFSVEDFLKGVLPVNKIIRLDNDIFQKKAVCSVGLPSDSKPYPDVIDISAVRSSCRKLKAGLISPAVEEVKTEVAKEHAAEPIKDMNDIDRISRYLIDNKRYRDNMLFIVGINFGLRVSDLRTLRFCQLINDDCTFRDRFPILEKKTRNTRKHQQNRYVTINTAVVEAVTLYLENTQNVCLSDYMFRSESNRGKNSNLPLSKQAIDLMLKGIASDLGLGNRMATHSLRKTFAYHQMVMSGNEPRKLLLLQKMFGHSTAAQTLDYIGITAEEIDDAYRKLNLGSVHNYLMDSDIGETAVNPA